MGAEFVVVILERDRVGIARARENLLGGRARQVVTPIREPGVELRGGFIAKHGERLLGGLMQGALDIAVAWIAAKALVGALEKLRRLAAHQFGEDIGGRGRHIARSEDLTRQRATAQKQGAA